MEMSLSRAKELSSEQDKIVAMIHFPPFNSRFDSSPFTELFEKYCVDSVVYGHLHGKSVRTQDFIAKNGVKYYLTSCDIIKNNPVLLKI